METNSSLYPKWQTQIPTEFNGWNCLLIETKEQAENVEYKYLIQSFNVSTIEAY